MRPVVGSELARVRGGTLNVGEVPIGDSQLTITW